MHATQTGPDWTVTVVVGRHARSDRSHSAVRRWIERLVDAATRKPGFVRAVIQPPEPPRVDDWVVIYEFSCHQTLQAWLTSDERIALCTDEAHFFEGSARQHEIATPNPATSVTAVTSFPLAAEHLPVFHEHYQALLRDLPDMPGFIRCELAETERRVPGSPVVVASFSTRAHLDAWLTSDRRRAYLDGIAPHLQGEPVTNIVAGFAGWFKPPQADPKVWKQAVIILVALYPTSLFLSWLRGLVLPDLGFAPGVFVVNALGVGVLTWILLPPLNQRFARWMRR